jgi:signal transduction histidine kinase
MMQLAGGLVAAPVAVPATANFRIDLVSGMRFHTDQSGTYTVGSFRDEDFRPGTPHFGSSNNAQWFVFNLRNVASDAVDSRLWLKDSPAFERVEIYTATDGKDFSKAGIFNGFKPFAGRLHPSKDMVIPIQVPAETTLTVLGRIDDRRVINFSPLLVSPNTYEESSRTEYLLYGAFFGSILITLINNILMFHRMRERSLLYYACYLVGIAMMFLSVSGLGAEYLWSGYILRVSILLAPVLIGVGGTLFGRSFLRIPELSPALNRVMGPAAGITALFGVGAFLYPSSVVLVKIIFSVNLIAISICIAAMYVAVRRKYAPAKLFSIAWAAFILGAVMTLLTQMEFTTPSFLSMYGMQIGAMIQMVCLSLASADQAADATKRIAILSEKRNAELEVEVDRRTHAMREIVENVRSGFFIVDQANVVKSGFTASCLEILGSQFAAERPLDVALGLTKQHFLPIKLALEQVFDDILPTSVSLSLVPNRLKIGERVVGIEGSAIRSKDHKIVKILFTVNDVSAVVAAETRKKIDDALIVILRQREAFSRFLNDFRSSLVEAKAAADRDDQRSLRQILHTVKGNASMFHFDKLSATIHAIEAKASIDASDVASVEATMRAFVQEYLVELGIEYEEDADGRRHVARKRVVEFREALAQVGDDGALRALCEAFAEELCRRPAGEFMVPLAAMAKNVAIKLEREIEVILSGSEIELDLDAAAPIVQNLPHLINNGLSHGIESPEERLAAGKSKHGTLRISVTESASQVTILVEDDGRGIDPEKIGRSALEKGVVTAAQLEKMSPLEKQWLIFLPSFSTAAEVTEVSGRGVGMDAVLAAVQRAKGTLTIESELGRGTTFRIVLAKNPPRDFSKNVEKARTARFSR